MAEANQAEANKNGRIEKNMKQEVITVLVPETDGRGRYRFRIPAFFETCKADYSRMLKALKADTDNAADNARVLLEAVQEAGPAYISTWDAAGRIKDLQNIAEGKQAEDRQQKQTNKMIELFCSKGKKAKLRPILSRPFVSDGIVYACDAFSAVKIENRSCYTGEVLPELNEYGKTPAAGNFFENPETVKRDYKQITLPALSVLKEWGKAGKMPAEPDNAAAFKADNVCIFAPYVYRMAALTGSNTLYINPEKPFSPVYMFSENFTVLALPYRPMGKQVDYIKNLPAVCLFTYNQETGPACLDCTEAETIHAAPVKQPRKAKKTDKPADDVQEETKPEPAAVPAGKEFSNYETGRAASDFAETVQKKNGIDFDVFMESYLYTLRLLKNRILDEYSRKYMDYLKQFPMLTDDEILLLHSLVKETGKPIITDKQKKAFICTLRYMQAKQEAPAADQEEKQAGPAETDHTAAGPAEAETMPAALEAETLEAETKPAAGTPAAGPEPVEKPAVIITEYRQIQEAETGHAEKRAKTAVYATKDGRPVKYPYQTENPAGTAQNRPKTENPAGLPAGIPGTGITCRHGIKQGTMASPLPINRQETGPPEKYGHNNGTMAGPGSFLRPSALSAPSVTFGKLE